MDDEFDALSALPYFRGLSTEELSQLHGRCYARGLNPGELIVLEGEPAAGLYVVRSGKVRVFKTSPQGKEQVLIVLGPGESFNDVPVFDGGANPASVQAAAPGTSVWVVPSSLVNHLLMTNPRIVSNVVRVLAAPAPSDGAGRRPLLPPHHRACRQAAARREQGQRGFHHADTSDDGGARRDGARGGQPCAARPGEPGRDQEGT